MTSTGTVQRPDSGETHPELTITPDLRRRGRYRARLGHDDWLVWERGADRRNDVLFNSAVQSTIDDYRADPQHIDAFALLNREYFKG